MTLLDAIARLEELEKAAIPPKWDGLSRYIEFSLCHDGDDEIQQTRDNRAMLVAARNALPSLLACVKALAEMVEHGHNAACDLGNYPANTRCTCGFEQADAALAQFLAAVGGPK